MTESMPVADVTKADLARALRVSERTVDNYVKRGLLPVPLKLGLGRSSPVRWQLKDLETLRKNLAALAQEPRAAA